jgi:hypothetical protein
VDRLLLPRVLEYTGGNQHQAALLLGIARVESPPCARMRGFFTVLASSCLRSCPASRS